MDIPDHTYTIGILIPENIIAGSDHIKISITIDIQGKGTTTICSSRNNHMGNPVTTSAIILEPDMFSSNGRTGNDINVSISIDICWVNETCAGNPSTYRMSC